MFYPVRILGPDGKTKKIIKSRELSGMYWKNFAATESRIKLTTTGQLKIPPWAKKKIEMACAGTRDATCYY